MRATIGTLWIFHLALGSLGCALVDSDLDIVVESKARVEQQDAEPSPESSGSRRPPPAPPPAPLAGLTVAGVASALTPPFEHRVTRYSVRATRPAEELSITATADPRFAIEIAGVPVPSGTPATFPGVSPGAEIHVRVSDDDGLVRKYTVVYLPHDFPEIDVTIKEPGASADPIYVALRSGRIFYLCKLDENGVPLFYRNESRDISDFKKHPGGEVSYATNVGGDQGGGVWEHVILNSEFEEMERVQAVGLEGTDHHDFLIRENGNLIVLAYEPAVRDLTEFGKSSEAEVIDAVFQELSPERDVLFQWNSWDYVSYDDNVRYPQTPPDYSHMNSVEVDSDGNWLVSARSFNQVLKIDRTTGDVLWRLGGKANEFTFIDDPYDGFCGQHTARRADNGNLTIFDNGPGCWPRGSGRGKLTRVAEYELDEEEKTARLVWSFAREGIYTASAGGAQRLANGNTFIGWGNHGAPTIATEVDQEGNVVFEFEARGLATHARSYRAFRFPD